MRYNQKAFILIRENQKMKIQEVNAKSLEIDGLHLFIYKKGNVYALSEFESGLSIKDYKTMKDLRKGLEDKVFIKLIKDQMQKETYLKTKKQFEMFKKINELERSLTKEINEKMETLRGYYINDKTKRI